jgi:hypothetical protein
MNSKAILSAHSYSYSYITADQTLSYLLLILASVTTDLQISNCSTLHSAQFTPLPAEANPDRKWKLIVSKLKKNLRNISIV